MKSEDLSYKIRELTDTSVEADLDWDSDKFWNLYLARKRRRKRLVLLSYSIAAMVIFAVAYIVFTADSINRYNDINSRVSSIPKVKKPVPVSKSEASYLVFSNSKPQKPIAAQARVFIRKPVKLSHNRSNDHERFVQQSTPVMEKGNDELPSLLQMFEQAQQERELRNLRVQLENQANYNSFWLTVNQHLIANKLNNDPLHYARY
ncbi:hypothetical protein [Dyadobacter psychrophilus]|uniref:Uncharacterized protein n=1 Tax=Dyadobacter psychrophilus TaxID=651661 RepID=A0A1T5HJ93_9BACT|nr:hypothetical protein [Dyadobacter psychrophilus]SKC20755.1 hypothetical protein SAMN05660293_05715 [Dyadobacter psychrophilus]